MNYGERMLKAVGAVAAAIMWAATAAAQAPVIGQGGAAPVIPVFVQGPHIFTAGPPPTITNCGGTTPIPGGNDNYGVVTPGTTTCTITFAAPWPQTPICSVAVSAASPTYTVSINAITVSATTTGVPLTWACVGRLG